MRSVEVSEQFIVSLLTKQERRKWEEFLNLREKEEKKDRAEIRRLIEYDLEEARLRDLQKKYEKEGRCRMVSGVLTERFERVSRCSVGEDREMFLNELIIKRLMGRR